MSCNKCSLLNICGFLKAGSRKNFSFKPVRSAKKVVAPALEDYFINLLFLGHNMQPLPLKSGQGLQRCGFWPSFFKERNKKLPLEFGPNTR